RGWFLRRRLGPAPVCVRTGAPGAVPGPGHNPGRAPANERAVTTPAFRHALPFARIGFLNMLAYRARYYVGVLTYLFNVAVYYFIWRAVFSHSTTVVGLSLGEMTTYLAVGWTIRSFYFNEIDRDIAAQVQEGRLA